jgi:hypothetical protein
MKKKAYIDELLKACAAKDKRILDLEETLTDAIDACNAGRMSSIGAINNVYSCQISRDRVHEWSEILKGKSHVRGD